MASYANFTRPHGNSLAESKHLTSLQRPLKGIVSKKVSNIGNIKLNPKVEELYGNKVAVR
jgi:hypothetical protein